jgi:protein involved in polysaccharide export with SLBB domain
MILIKSNYIKRVLLFCIFVFSIITSTAQLPGGVNIDKLTDDQLMQYAQQAGLVGLSEKELETKAAEKGLNADQIQKLKARLSISKSSGKAGVTNNATSTEARIAPKVEVPKAVARDEIAIYGSDLFSSGNVTFEPNLKIATPTNYILGVDDELQIDLFGVSEKVFKVKVNTDGFIRIPNIGPIKVNGLNISEATIKIKAALSKQIYPEINSGATNVQITLGQIRTIRVTIIGEAKVPGAYSLSSLSTIANALFVSGGPGLNGSFRDIELVRNGKTIVHFDIYDFLLKADLSKNILLHDDDIIKVNIYKIRATLTGSIKRQAIYEGKGDETITDFIRFAGGFTDVAYKQLIQVNRIGQREREIISLQESDLLNTKVKSGDIINIATTASSIRNRVSIDGAIFFPGEYAIEKYGTLKELLAGAQLKPDAFLSSATIKRLDDLGQERLLSVNLNSKDVVKLKSQDVIIIYSVNNFNEAGTVQVTGEVNKPSEIVFTKGLNLKDVLIQSGGFKESAESKNIEISRRMRGLNAANDSSIYTIIKTFNINKDLTQAQNELNFLLEPFDLVSVKKLPNYRSTSFVTFKGEVLYPGVYALYNDKEKLSTVLKRAGGLKQAAYPKGAYMFRNTFGEDISEQMLNVKKSIVTNKELDDTSSMLNLDAYFNKSKQVVDLKLDEAIKDTSSVYNLFLQNGDEIQVPNAFATIQSAGELYFPKKIIFRNGITFMEVVNESGGYKENALVKKGFVLYPNGTIKKVKKSWLFFRKYPTLEPGADLIIPSKQARKKNKLTTTEVIGITTAITALISLVFLIKASL